MKKRKLGIIGGVVFTKWKVLKILSGKKVLTSWGNPSDQVLTASYMEKKYVLFQDIREDIKLIQQILITGRILMR